MPKKTNKTNPYDIIRQLKGATHLEVQYFLPYLPAWLASEDDPMLADMNSITLSLLFYALEGQLFVPQSNKWTN